MTDENQTSEEEQVQQLYAFVAAEMKSGADKSAIAAKLVEGGTPRAEAEQLVDTMHREITKMVEQEQFSAGGLVPALVGGILGALVGGAVWAGIVVVTDYEVGFVAWGIGALCGFAVVMFTRGSKGFPLQVIAVVTSVLGIAIGKYFSFYHFLKQVVIEEEGAEAAEQLSVISPNVIAYFVQTLPQTLGLYDLLWVGLAVFTAWGIPKGSGIPAQRPSGPIG